MPTLLLSWVAVGILMGLWFFLFSRRRTPGGMPVCFLVGILGSAVGGYLVAAETNVDPLHASVTYGGLLTSAVAATVTLAIWKIATHPPAAE